MEQAVIATFLYPQPIGQEARLRDLVMLVGPTAPHRIELEKGMIRWAQESHWLDDRYSTTDGTKVPQVWRMGNRPNLKQMHEVARKQLSVKTDIIEARLIDEIDDCKKLTEGCKGSGAQLSIMPKKPSDLSDDGAFHFVILGPKASSERGKPSTEARRFLDETSGPDKPRVFRNSIVAVAPSKDGLDLARSRVLDLLAWEQVAAELEQGIKKGEIESSRLHTLTSNVDTARQRVPDAIRQAYCIVVTVAEDDTDQAFKINVSDDPLFITGRGDRHYCGGASPGWAVRSLASRRDGAPREGLGRCFRAIAEAPEDAQREGYFRNAADRVRARCLRAAPAATRSLIPFLVAFAS